jgi:hypothetical protein
MARVFFELLILLKLILYSKYERRPQRRYIGHVLAQFMLSQFSNSRTSMAPVQRTSGR